MRENKNYAVENSLNTDKCIKEKKTMRLNYFAFDEVCFFSGGLRHHANIMHLIQRPQNSAFSGNYYCFFNVNYENKARQFTHRPFFNRVCSSDT